MNLLKSLQAIKEVMIYVGIPLLVVMTIHANSIAAKNGSTTAQLVKSQGVVLKAIRDAQTDNRLTQDQKSNLLICLALVPQNERTLDIVNNCRKTAGASVSNDNSGAKTLGNSSDSGRSEVDSSPNNAPSKDNPQSDIPQDDGVLPDSIPLIGPLL